MRRSIPADRLPLLKTDPAQGLSEQEASARRQRFGSNRIAERPPHSGAALARDTARDPMIWFLLLTGLLFLGVGDYRDAGILALAIIPLVGMDFFLHRRAEVSIEALGSVLAASALAVRGAQTLPLPAADLVPGDIAVVEAGTSFPADGLILSGGGLDVDESVLTGEANPVGKTAWMNKRESANIAEDNWVSAGTRLLTGKAIMVVVFTGQETIYGQIVQTAMAGPTGQTRLQKAVLGLVRLLLVGALALCALLAAVRLWQGFGLLDAVISAATLAVAAIPEEFPVVLTFFLAAGVVHLARRRALVRHAMAVENIGRVSIICTDKTGTITEGRLSLSSIIPAPGMDEGDLLRTASMAAQSGTHDPLDAAIAARAPPLDALWSLKRLYPFTEGRRHEAAYWANGEGHGRFAIKGAAEEVIAMCDLAPDERRDWQGQIADASRRAEKVIACAAQERPEDLSSKEPPSGYRLTGLLGFSDPLKPTAREALARARQYGVKVVMVTGDHPETAAAIARASGIASDPAIVTGEELKAASADAAPLSADVFARVSPSQKKQVVSALRRPGAVIAVTGDGVNDVPALREADVGIAMGLKGTRSAREIADIVLLDDNLGTIVDAIAEGRQLFANLKRSFAFLLMIHIPLVLSAAAVPFLGYPLLYLPVHIVWLELLIHPSSILAFASRADGRPIPAPEANFFSRFEWVVIAAAGLLITAAVTLTFLTALDLSIGEARTSALICLVAALGTLTLLLSHGGRVPSVITAIAWLSTGLPLLPGAAAWLRLAPLPAHRWLVAFGAGLLTGSAALAIRACRHRNPPSAGRGTRGQNTATNVPDLPPKV